MLHEFQGVHEHDVTNCRFLPNNIHVATVSKDGNVCVWNTSSLSLSASMSSDKSFSSLCVNLEQSSINRQVEMIAGAHDGSASLFSISEDMMSIRCLSTTRPSAMRSDVIGYQAKDDDE